MTKQIVFAEFIEDVPISLIRRTEALWRPDFRRLKQEALDRGVPEDDLPLEHSDWDWERKKRGATKESRFFGVEYDGRAQCLMMISTGLVCKIPEQAGLPLVYVDYLEVAPWNQSRLVVERPFAGLGGLLLDVAISISRELGHEGKIGLHSLKQSETFYRNCRMTDCGVERFGYNRERRFFEMTPEQARSFSEGGY